MWKALYPKHILLCQQRKEKSNGDLLFNTPFNLGDFTKLISSYDICYYFSESPSTTAENHSNFPAAFALVEKATKPGSFMTLMTKFGRILGAFIKQKFRSEISETSRAQWNGTFLLHRPDSNHGVCKTRTLYLLMADADGKMRIEKCGWEKMLIVRGKNEKCGWCGETSFKRKFISLSTMLCTCI